MAVVEWVVENWTLLAVPIAVFVAVLLVLAWIRQHFLELMRRWATKMRWPAVGLLVRPIASPSLIWIFILAIYLGLLVSATPPEWKEVFGRGLGTIFLLSVSLSVASLATGLISFFGPRTKMPPRNIGLLKNTARIVVITMAFLIALGIWGVPTTPLILFLAVAIVAAILAFRDAVPNFYAGFQISASEQIRPGDYIKMESGEEGYVLDVNWRNTRIKTLDEKVIFIPNSRLVQRTVVNYGKPLKRATSPFRFASRTHLTELTGLKARNLQELADMLSKAPDSVVYYHTHRSLQEHHQLSPDPSNDFAQWVTDALGNEVLGERLASIDTFSFPTLGALRAHLVSTIKDGIARETHPREAREGRSFYFMKSVSVIYPAPYVAHDMREFVEALRKLTPGSLYFHVFESRLRLGRGANDLSIWIDESIGDKELAEEVARLDPYMYTLEGLRSALIRLIEKRIK